MIELICCECDKLIGYLDEFFKDSEAPGWCQGNEYCPACWEKVRQ
jgi:hypothetical protein